MAFEEAVVDTLKIKCRRALEQQHCKTLVIAGGVGANKRLRLVLAEMIEQIKGFSDEDMAMVINYVSRIPVNPEELAPSADWLNPDFD